MAFRRIPEKQTAHSANFKIRPVLWACSAFLPFRVRLMPSSSSPSASSRWPTALSAGQTISSGRQDSICGEHGEQIVVQISV